MRKKAQKVYVWRVKVRCRSVPFDMMRYDNCVPASEVESGKLERLGYWADRRSGTAKTSEEIEFRMFDYGGQGPTVDRWKSFSCEVISFEAVY